MASKPFLKRLPPIPIRLALEALMELIESQFDEQYRDFVTNPRPDHMLVNLVVLLAWVRGLDLKRGDRDCDL